MWSEEINKKIQEAGDSNHAAYNDKAWESMELLLDKHLPLKKKRRRFIFLLFPLFLGVATVFFILQKRDTKNNPVTGQKNIPTQTALSPADQSMSSRNRLPATPENITTPSKKTPAGEEIKKSAENNIPEIKISDPNITTPGHTYSKKLNSDVRRKEQVQTQSFSRKKSIKKTETIPDNNFDSDKPVIPAISTPGDNIIVKKSIHPIDSIAIQKTVAAKDNKHEDTALTETTKTETKKEKSKTPASSKLSLNLSFGPDISSVGIDNPGRIEMQYGIGVSYALSKRFTIRTGFFAGSKKYTADSSDYHLRYSITNLQKVDADCFVYEIPLTLIYNFPTTKKHNWFVSGGLSSYLMKKETYEYYYKNSWGQPQRYKRTYKNENSHLFSVINLSGGYQYHFTDRFSVMAEPYIKIPASGIGVGKVKFNSSGILFTIGFKPFQKEK